MMLWLRKAKQTALKIQAAFQTKNSSFAQHNLQYLQQGKLERERLGIQEMLKRKAYDDDSLKLCDLLSRYPLRKLCVDIGSGNGWFSAYLSQFFEKVEGIEPSAAATSIAAALYPASTHPNISWNLGFAEEILNTLPIDQTPTLFVTGCVLSHLRDREAATICKIINTRAKIGSILSWSECWGDEFHRYLWHVRTKEWWRRHLSHWDLDFHGGEIENVPGRHKGFHGIKAN